MQTALLRLAMELTQSYQAVSHGAPVQTLGRKSGSRQQAARGLVVHVAQTSLARAGVQVVERQPLVVVVVSWGPQTQLQEESTKKNRSVAQQQNLQQWRKLVQQWGQKQPC